jgi:hypothetical protein
MENYVVLSGVFLSQSQNVGKPAALIFMVNIVVGEKKKGGGGRRSPCNAEHHMVSNFQRLQS